MVCDKMLFYGTSCLFTAGALHEGHPAWKQEKLGLCQTFLKIHFGGPVLNKNRISGK